ncbi:hypothetical protein TrLO_g11942 [Triparma laevis f. longispina]|uniref:Thioredoxin domain-containing protein n=1 Tax=Triparma laevis f. longispina TaxID=1714387 RepID=A0A9W7FP40_9STRA|nr:hypothetical protein TrLO_g11942 [Triparma laevis f. longispina]
MIPTRFLSLYYFTNFLVPLLYFVLIYPKYRTDGNLQAIGFSTVLNKEEEWIAMMVGTYLIKFRRHATIDESVQKFFMHLKVLSLALTFDCNRQMAYYLIGLYSVMFVTVQPGKFQGAQRIEHLNPVSLKSRVRKPEGAADKSAVWIVAFWADWCETCTFLEAMLASLSIKYSKAGLEFGKVDVVKYPELAEEFRIDTSGTSWQLPTIILFYKGVEVKRLPPFKSDGTVVKTKMDEKGVTKFFELDKDVAEMSFKSGKARGGGGGSSKKKD